MQSTAEADGVQRPWLGVTVSSVNPAGSESCSVTPPVSLGPRFSRVSVQLRFSPTSSGWPEFTIESRRSPDAWYGVEVPSLLSDGSGSAGEDVEMVTVSTSVASTASLRETTIWSVVFVPEGRLAPRAAAPHVTVPVEWTQPGLAETNVMPDGSVFVTTGSDAGNGPRFATSIEYVRLWPASSTVLEAVRSTDTSAPAATCVVAVAWLFALTPSV